MLCVQAGRGCRVSRASIVGTYTWAYGPLTNSEEVSEVSELAVIREDMSGYKRYPDHEHSRVPAATGPICNITPQTSNLNMYMIYVTLEPIVWNIVNIVTL